METIRAGTPAGSSASKTTLIVFGIYGIAKMQNQNYIIAVTKVEYAAAIADKNIYLATEFKFVGLKCKDSSEDAVRHGSDTAPDLCVPEDLRQTSFLLLS